MKLFMGLLVIVLSSVSCGSDEPVHRVEKVSKNALIIDVRTVQEFRSGHIKGAIHIPHTVIGSQIQNVTDEKEREILLYCRSGQRSGMALETLTKLGYTNAKNVGGYAALKKQLGQ